VFLEFVIDPACSLVFEAERADADLMSRPPRSSREPLFGRSMLMEAVALGLVALVTIACVYVVALANVDEGEARAMAFVTFVAANLALILATRSRHDSLVAIVSRPNRVFWWIAGSALTALAIVVMTPGAARLFRFETPSASGLGASVAAGVLSVVWIEGLRWWHRRRTGALPRSGTVQASPRPDETA
jgi:Ca2+-transporting ATPase